MYLFLLVSKSKVNILFLEKFSLSCIGFNVEVLNKIGI